MNRQRRRVATIVTLFVGASVLATVQAPGAQAAQLSAVNVADINTGAVVGPREFVTAGASSFFAGGDGTTGTELWKTDGTSGGTVQVKDINTQSNSAPAHLTAVGSTLFFTAIDSTSNGVELWKSDGTTGGTSLLKNIRPGGGRSSDPDSLADVAGTLFFAATAGPNGEYAAATGRELWKSNGTAAGTVLVKDIWSGFDSSPGEITDLGSTALFAAWEGGSGRELWKSNGTASGTVLVKDIWPGGTASSTPTSLTVSGGVLYFAANDGVNGVELWRSDGTAAGTVMVSDIHTTGSSSPTGLTDVGGTLYFAANDGTNGVELWRSDGTEAGTVMVSDIHTTGSSSPSELTDVNGILFFSSDDGVVGRELWKSDGTGPGTQLVSDIRPSGDASPAALANVGGTLHFAANDGTNGVELWRSDGTAAGTELLKDLDPSGDGSPERIAEANGVALFAANEDVTGFELWVSDGTGGGTSFLKDIITGAGTNSLPGKLTDVNGTLFFSANDGITGRELWKSDGTPGGTELVKDINPEGDSAPDWLANVGGLLFFSAFEPSTGRELWRSDGTEEGTYIHTDIWQGPTSSSPMNITHEPPSDFVHAIFSAKDSTFGREPFHAAEGQDAQMIANINPTGDSIGNFTNINEFVVVNKPGVRDVFFAATDGTNGYELWKWNQFGSVVSQVKDINTSGDGISAVFGGENVGGTLFFAASDASTSRELWKSDGTTAGTTLVKDLNTGNFSGPEQIIDFNGTVIFVAPDTSGWKLWRSDGTTAGTTIVKQLGGSAIEPTVVGGTLFFSFFEPTTGNELWRSDGTTSGTQVLDVVPGAGGIFAGLLENVNGTLLFRATDFQTGNASGYELWRSDGTLAGTSLVRDIRAGSGDSLPNDLTNVGGTLFFSADDGLRGRELWMTFMAPDISIDDVMVTEGDSGITEATFHVTLDQPASIDVSVKVTIEDGSAARGSDYAAAPTILTFTPGQASKDVTVDVMADALEEGDETFTVSLSDAVNAGILDGVGLGTILDDDSPDLIESGVGLSATSAKSRAGIKVTDTVTNIGAVPAGATTTRYYLSSDPARGPANVLMSRTRSVPALAAGATSTGTAKVKIPTVRSGDYYVLACADDTNLVVERTEANNCAASPQIYVLAKDIDFVVSSVDAPAAASSGESITVGDTTANAGAGDGPGSTTTRYYLSADTKKTNKDPVLGSRNVPALASNASHAGTASVVVPEVAPGSYYVLACADDPRLVKETNEKNNCTASPTQIVILGLT